MGHPNEEWLRRFFQYHRDEIELWSPSALVTKALEQFKQREWVSVDELLPDQGMVLVFTPECLTTQAYYSGSSFYEPWGNEYPGSKQPVYWMPLPEPPHGN